MDVVEVKLNVITRFSKQYNNDTKYLSVSFVYIIQKFELFKEYIDFTSRNK